MKKTYSHITKVKRYEISILRNKGYSIRSIAKEIEKNPSSISREINRNRRKIRKKGGTIDGIYESDVANHKAYIRRRNSKYQGIKIWRNDELRRYIEIKMRKGWSPDVISGRMKIENKPFYASKTAIYDFIYSSYGQYLAKHLSSKKRSKRKRNKKKTKKTLIPNRIGIEYRIIDGHGHYEGDTIVSGRSSKTSLSVIYEKRFKYVDILKIPCLKPKMNKEAVNMMINRLNNPRTFTLDNGIENMYHEQFNVDTFFCDPYSPWQKGGIENVNRLIRRHITKGSDISKYSDKYIENICKKLNNTPRKSLGYMTPMEMMKRHNLIKVEQPIIIPFQGIKNTSGVALEG